MTRRLARCIPVVAITIGVGALLICTAAAQASSGGGPVAYSSGAGGLASAAQPAISGLFQLNKPRAWTDVLDEDGRPGANGVPDFLDSWDAFHDRTSWAVFKNAYAFTTIDTLSHEILYAGVQRLADGAAGSVVFEFNQKPGERTPRDLRVSAEIDAAGRVGTVAFESYSLGTKGSPKFLSAAILAGEGCNDAGTACVVANGALLEAGFNLTELGKPQKEFSGVQIRTPESDFGGAIRILSAWPGVSGSCVKEVGGVNNPTCTAGDVRLSGVKDVVIAAGDQCDPGNPNDVIVIQSFTGIFTSGPQRYDIGTYIATDGGGSDGARSGSCIRIAFKNDTTGLVDLDGDSCADIAASQTAVEIPMGPITIKCSDAFHVGADGNPAAGGDDNIDFFHCETWAQQANEILCDDSTDVKAGTPSKCGCSLIGAEQGFCVPESDNNDCTTDVCQGKCQTLTGGGSQTPCSSNAGCLTAGETCRGIKIEHVPVANGTVCGSDPGASNPCDLAPTCQSGSCTPSYASNTTECRAKDGECDIADKCTGTSATCSSDAVASNGTGCTDDGNVCTNDLCNGTSKSCTHPAFADGPRTGCNAAGDQCNNGAQCVSGNCQTSSPKAPGTPCENPAVTSGPCDAPDECESGVCVEKYAPTTQVCRAAANPCDAPENCPGDGPNCVTDLCKGGAPDFTIQCTAPPGS